MAYSTRFAALSLKTFKSQEMRGGVLIFAPKKISKYAISKLNVSQKHPRNEHYY